MPFSVGDEACRVAATVVLELKVNPGHVVRPRTELHLAQLVVERKPRDVDLTRAQEKSGRYPETVAGRRYDHVRRKRTVDVLIGTARRTMSCSTTVKTTDNNVNSQAITSLICVTF